MEPREAGLGTPSPSVLHLCNKLFRSNVSLRGYCGIATALHPLPGWTEPTIWPQRWHLAHLLLEEKSGFLQPDSCALLAE